MNRWRLTYPLLLLCRVLRASRRSYYAWACEPPFKAGPGGWMPGNRDQGRPPEDARNLWTPEASVRSGRPRRPGRYSQDSKDPEGTRASMQTGQEIPGDDALKARLVCSGESSRSRFYCHGAQARLGERSERCAHS